MTENKASIQEVYRITQDMSKQLLKSMDELKKDVRSDMDRVEGSVNQLRNDFMTMEKGRLTNAEVTINKLQLEIQLMKQRETDRTNETSTWKSWIVPAILYVIGQVIVFFIIKSVELPK